MRVAVQRPRPLAVIGVFLALSAGATALALGGCRPREAPAQSDGEIHRLGTVSMEALSAYAGSEACRSCHEKEFTAHAKSGHAQALTRVTPANHGERFAKKDVLVDPIRELRYRMLVAAGECLQEVDHLGKKALVAARYGFGSGRHATTYLGERDQGLVELRLSYYGTGGGRWHFSPGQTPENIAGGVLYPEGLVHAPKVDEECFVCHSTAVAKDDQALRLDRSILGVGCESCHGPGKRHIEAAQKNEPDLRMTRLGSMPERLTTELCGQCHRSPVSEDPADPFNRGQMARLQGLALSQSACFIKSSGRLSCVTCHDPHGGEKPTRITYNAKCISCHDAKPVEERPCTIEPAGDCVSCHMPAQKVGMPTDLKYRTHLIKVWLPE